MQLIRILLILVIAAVTTSLNAQSTANLTMREKMQMFLQQDAFIEPGVGFRQIRLGITFSEVLDIWGAPEKEEKSVLPGSKRSWFYKPEGVSLIILSGKDTVDTITVRGTPASIFQTLEGARFGISPDRVLRIYGEPSKEPKEDLIRYPELGVEFAFANQRLGQIDIIEKDI